MKTYNQPRLADLGDVQGHTGIFGSSSQADVFVGPNGQVVQRGTGSIDACATANFEQCLAGRS